MDFAGDISAIGSSRRWSTSVSADKIFFGSDFPWMDAQFHLTRVLLADVDDRAKQKILAENARAVHRVLAQSC